MFSKEESTKVIFFGGQLLSNYDKVKVEEQGSGW